jgi:hypothetical protein
MVNNALVFLVVVLFLTPHLPVNHAHEIGSGTETEGSDDEDNFEDLGHVVLDAPKVEGRLRILQITDLHRFPKGVFHRPMYLYDLLNAACQPTA